MIGIHYGHYTIWLIDDDNNTNTNTNNNNNNNNTLSWEKLKKENIL